MFWVFTVHPGNNSINRYLAALVTIGLALLIHRKSSKGMNTIEFSQSMPLASISILANIGIPQINRLGVQYLSRRRTRLGG